MSGGIGWAIALLLADIVLVVAMGLAFRRRTGRTVPFVLAVLAGVVFVLLIATVGVAVLN